MVCGGLLYLAYYKMSQPGMPHKRTQEGQEARRAADTERKRKARRDREYRERENKRDRERRFERRRTVDDWVTYDWENKYVALRHGIEAYRPLLQQLHSSDLRTNVRRIAIYETTPLKVELRADMPRVWQTNRSATISIPGAPIIKRFKVFNPFDGEFIPIGEGELVRRYLGRFKKGKHLFPKSVYKKVANVPIFFCPQAPPDLLEFDCEYVDISRCYSQLLGRLPSLAVQFHYSTRRFDPIDNLPPYDVRLLESKHFGRAVVGMLRQPTGRVFLYGEPVRFPSAFYSGDTASWVHACLHALASYAVASCGCFRWHTDGGFFPVGGGLKFSRHLETLGIIHTIEYLAAVIFANVDQYEAIYEDGNVKQTKLFTSTYIDDYVFSPANMGGGQRDNLIHGLDESWLYSTLEREQ